MLNVCQNYFISGHKCLCRIWIHNYRIWPPGSRYPVRNSGSQIQAYGSERNIYGFMLIYGSGFLWGFLRGPDTDQEITKH
jgi:hypothetical protein